jgi:cytochrome c5
MRISAICAVLVLALTPAAALADEVAIQLKNGPGVDVVEGNCGACHSLDYLPMNSPIQDKEGWGKTVAKMVKVFGAPISDADQATIISYLGANYGK